jgi:anti-anti-sigma regulatory factor
LAWHEEAGLGSFAGIVDFEEMPPLLRCVGDEDRTTQGSRRQALARAISAQADVIVDLSGLVFADSSLMLDLAMLSRRLRTRGRALRLRGAQPQIWTLIELVGLHRLPGVRVEGPAPALA